MVYKPRDLGHPRAVRRRRAAGSTSAAPDLGLRTAAALAGDGYGWVEFVPARPLPDRAAADRFYRRQGALLALLHALHAADMHFENVIACGDQPVLVDIETLFHPSLATPTDAGDPAARMLAESVHRTGLLPIMVVGEGGAATCPALGGAARSPDVVADWAPDEHGGLRPVPRPVTPHGGGNLPTGSTAASVDVTDHEAALLAGFRQAYDAIMRHRAEFAELLDGCARRRGAGRGPQLQAATRRLLAESTRPELLRDGLDRDQALDVLWTESAARTRCAGGCAATSWPTCGRRTCRCSPPGPARPTCGARPGDRLPGVLGPARRSTSALAKVDAMSEVDRRDQEWIISAALATRGPPAGTTPRRTARARHLAGTAATTGAAARRRLRDRRPDRRPPPRRRAIAGQLARPGAGRRHGSGWCCRWARASAPATSAWRCSSPRWPSCPGSPATPTWPAARSTACPGCST